MVIRNNRSEQSWHVEFSNSLYICIYIYIWKEFNARTHPIDFKRSLYDHFVLRHDRIGSVYVLSPRVDDNIKYFYSRAKTRKGKYDASKHMTKGFREVVKLRSE